MSDWLNAEAHADRALEMYERGRWAEAESELRKALALNPNQAEWHFNLGLTLEAAGRDLEALGSYERAQELAPDQPEAMVACGAACNRLGRYERALNWLEEALSIEPAFEGAYAHKIESHIRLGDHDQAETTFYLAQQALPGPSAQCLAVIAESLIQRRKWERAGWCLREALRLDPTLPRLRARLAAVAAAVGRPQRALQLYLRDLRDDPGNIETLLDYGELLIELGRMPEASEKFRRVLELEPANVDAHERLGQIAMQRRRFEQAHLEFELVFKLDPQFPQIRLSLAEALLRRGLADTARQRLREELALLKEEEGGRRTAEDSARFGLLLLEADLPSEAVMLFERAIESGGEDPDLLRKLALARFRSGDRDGGVAASRRVVRLDPTCVASMHNLALAALKEGRLSVAQGWVARGLRVNRHDDGLRRLRMRLWLTWIAVTVRRWLGPRR
ncbi:MAG: tetratricopeptide repeat protein [Phycisphaerales bacterium]|nr:MAG: tetratricopeptide repeat protein [Phycisphaerales bacterium]